MKVIDRISAHTHTKKQLLSWLNSLLQINVNTIQQLSNGAAFCQILDAISPGTVRMQKLNWNAKLQHQNLANLKILSTSMLALGINKQFDVTRIAQKKHQDILELLQWFRKYFQELHLDKKHNYDPVARRKAQIIQKSQIESTSRQSIQNSKKQKAKSIPKPEMLTKQQFPQKDQNFELKNCQKINQEIKRIVVQERVPPQTKLQLIKQLMLNDKSNIDSNAKTDNIGSQQSIKVQQSHLKTDKKQTYIDNNLLKSKIKIQDEHQNMRGKVENTNNYILTPNMFVQSNKRSVKKSNEANQTKQNESQVFYSFITNNNVN